MSVSISLICCDCVEKLFLGKVSIADFPNGDDWILDRTDRKRNGEKMQHIDTLRMVEKFLLRHFGHEIRLINEKLDDFYDFEPEEYKRDWGEEILWEAGIDDDYHDERAISKEEVDRIRRKLNRESK